MKIYPVTANKNIQRSGKMVELLVFSRYLSINLVSFKYLKNTNSFTSISDPWRIFRRTFASLNIIIFIFYLHICGQIFKLQIRLVVFVKTFNFHQSIQYDLYYHKIHRSSHLKEIVGVLDCLIAVNIIRIH